MIRTFISLGLAIIVLSGTISCKKQCDCECPEPEQKTVTFRPGPNDGQDCLVAYRENDGGVYANDNLNNNPDIYAGRWTFSAQGWGQGTDRTYFKFPGVSTIPQNATIQSARLSLFGISSGTAAPQGNSYYSGSPYASYGDNKTWLKRVTGDWSETTITWNNKPGTTDANQLELPASASQWNFNIINIDVTNMVKDMVANNQNYGFCMQLQVEQIYRCIVFASSEVADSTRRPELVVEYDVQ